MPIVEVVTQITAPPPVCFDLARDIDFHQRSLAHTGERAVAGVSTGLIGMSQSVTWRGRHFGVPLHHTATITAFEPPHFFQDTMTDGRFARFVHDHVFEGVGGGCRMTDRIDFGSPFGWVGAAIDRLVLRRYLEHLIHERGLAIKQEAEGR